jgi:hypothetical protein
MLGDLKLHTERQGYLLIKTKDFEVEIVDPINPAFIPEPNYYDVTKHGTHDQKTHGSWAGGGSYPTKDSHPELKNSLKEYVSEYPKIIGYQAVNRYLRLDESNLTDEAMSQTKKVISDLDKLVELSPSMSQPTTAYKGVHEKLIADLVKLGVGGTYQDKGFVSVSLKKDIALGFPSFRSGNLIEIDMPSEVKAINPYQYFGRSSVSNTKLAHEKELILGRGNTFEITGIENTEYGTTIKARLVP